MKIGLDLEVSLADVHIVWVRNYNLHNGTDHTVADINKWDFYKHPDTKFVITQKEFFDSFKKLWRESWEEIPLVEENICSILNVLQQKHIMDIVTKTVAAYESKEPILAWLKKNCVPYHNLITLPIEKSKLDLDYDLIIDDDPRLAEKAKQCQKRVLLYSCPWNQDVEDNHYMTRIHSFSEIPALV